MVLSLGLATIPCCMVYGVLGGLVSHAHFTTLGSTGSTFDSVWTWFWDLCHRSPSKCESMFLVLIILDISV